MVDRAVAPYGRAVTKAAAGMVAPKQDRTRMNQNERMNSASNLWEADPWDTSDEIADIQLAGFEARAIKPLAWFSIQGSGYPVFGLDHQKLIEAGVEYYATHDGEDMLLMRLWWHGFPDPPEWRLATRPTGKTDQLWTSWGYFADLPQVWKVTGKSGI